jgi:hypothetical protein
MVETDSSAPGAVATVRATVSEAHGCPPLTLLIAIVLRFIIALGHVERGYHGRPGLFEERRP